MIVDQDQIDVGRGRQLLPTQFAHGEHGNAAARHAAMALGDVVMCSVQQTRYQGISDVGIGKPGLFCAERL